MKNTSLILFFLVSLLMIGCQDKREALPTISVGHALHDHHAALFIAAQLPDYFYQQGGVYLKEIEFKKHFPQTEDLFRVRLGEGGGYKCWITAQIL